MSVSAEIYEELRNQYPDLAKYRFFGATWHQIPNTPFDRSLTIHSEVYAAQSGMVTVLAYRNPIGHWKLKVVQW